MIRRLIGLILMGVFLVGLMTGCNTMRGVGEDVEGAGEEIQESTTP